MSRQAQKIIEAALEENGGAMPHDDLVDRVVREQDVTENTARDYITMYCEREERGGDDDLYAFIPRIEDSTSQTEMEVGEPTDDDFRAGLAILENVGHPMVPEGHSEGYYQRRIKLGTSEHGQDEGKIDVDVVCHALRKGFNVMLRGETGVGKDSLAKYIAANRNQPVYQVNFSKDIRSEDLLGHYELVSDGDETMEMQKVYGPLARAAKTGGIFLADEINAAGGGTTMALHSATEKLENRKLPVPQFSEVIEPHPEFRVIGTMNPNYAGTKPQNRAFMNRFVHVELDWMNVGQIKRNEINDREVQIIFDNTNLAADREDQVEDLVMLASSLREDYKNGVIVTPISTRELIQVASYMENGFMSLEDAAKMVIVGIADENDKTSIHKTIETSPHT